MINPFSPRRHLYADPIPATNQYAWRAAMCEHPIIFERRDPPQCEGALFFPFGGPIDAPEFLPAGSLRRTGTETEEGDDGDVPFLVYNPIVYRD